MQDNNIKKPAAAGQPVEAQIADTTLGAQFQQQLGGQPVNPVQQPAQPTFESHISRSQGLNRLTRRSNHGATRGVIGGNISKICKSLEEAYLKTKETQGAVDMLFIPIDRSSGLSHSLVAVAQETETNVYVSLILVESTGEKPASITTRVFNDEVVVERYAADCFDERLRLTTRDTLKNRFNKNITECSNIVLPADVDVENENALSSYLFYAVESVLQASLGLEAQGLSITDFENVDSLDSKMEYGNIQSGDAAGHPIRSDITICTDAVIQGGNGVPTEAVPIFTTSAYVDLTYFDPKQAAMGINPQNQLNPVQQHLQMHPFACYLPKLIVTAVQCKLECEPLEVQLLGLATSTLLRDNLAWIHQFRPTVGADSEMRDVGALGHHAPLNLANGNQNLDKVRTQTAKFDADSMLRPMLSEAVVVNERDQPMTIQFDIPVGGELSWLNDIFISSTRNAEAKAEIIAAANRLTGNHFSTFFDSKNPIIVGNIDTIHMGYFEGSDQTKHDLRSIDIIAMLNRFGKKEPLLVTDFANTFENFNISEVVRLRDRLTIMRKYDPNIVVTGLARRLFINPHFISALISGLGACNTKLRSTNAYFHDAAVSRGNAHINDYLYQGMGGFGSITNNNVNDTGNNIHGVHHTNRYGNVVI